MKTSQCRRSRKLLPIFLFLFLLFFFGFPTFTPLPETIIPQPRGNGSISFEETLPGNSSISHEPPTKMFWGNLRRPHENRKIIFLLHIHKSGGTTMCALASLNHLRVNKKDNCNVQLDQRCCGGSDSLQAQIRFAAVTFYQFVANEGDMYESMDPLQYQYIVVLRNSTDRYISHWEHMCREHSNQTLPEFDTWWKAQPDNWNFRKLCGTRCQTVPKFQITRALFEYTFDRLKLFDHVLLLEHWDNMYPQLAQSLGWRSTSNLHIRPHPTNVSYPELGSAWDPFMSVLDDALYEWRLAQFQGREKRILFDWTTETNDRLEQYFTMGLGRGCASPCCAESCSAYR